ncbi:MAG: hypothetical protein IIZ51_09210, partial [Lachnospiraceae bacterium]|nr:hypothetical protein [Lachnospiraceae bacterium]
MNKKKKANLIMVVIIAAVAVCGILAVGKIRGWFDRDTGEAAVLTEIRGIVTMERDSAAYDADSDTVLREGDRLTTGMGATCVLQVGDDRIELNEHTEVLITDPSTESFAAEISAGEAFVNAKGELTLALRDRDVVISDAAALVSVREGAQSVSVLDGEIDGEEAGRLIEWIGDTRNARDLSINSLNTFAIDRILAVNESRPLFFTNGQIETLLEERHAEMEAMLNRASEDETEDETAETDESETAAETTAAGETAPSQPAPGEST